MENVEIEVLTCSTYPVVRMLGRRFPGIVVQGDTLSTFVSDTKAIVAELRAGNRPLDDAQYLADGLAGLLDRYTQTLTDHGIDLPDFPET